MKNSPLTLAVETSGRIGSVGLARAEKFLEQITFTAPIKHSAEIFPAMKTLLEKHNASSDDIQQVYISAGPGSFTGLRIAVTFAKMMALADNNIKIVTVNTLDGIAANVIDQQQTDINRLGIVLDAKRGQFFSAVYERTASQWTKTADDCLINAGEFKTRFRDSQNPLYLAGEGLMYYAEKFEDIGIEILDEDLWRPQSVKIHSIGYKKAVLDNFTDPAKLQPAYIREPEIGKKRTGL